MGGGIALLAAFWLRHLWAAPLHEDEAIYAAWALRLLRGDPWLLATPVDKPPLTFYPLALSLALFGRADWAARLPALGWTALMLVALWRLDRRQGGTGWLAVGLALGSPLLWAQAASAFTDPAMVALALLALERARAARPAQAGLALALACLAKPTALFWLPLIALTLPLARAPLDGFILAGAAPLLAAWAWDASRAAPSWWLLGAQAYGTLGDPAARFEAWCRVSGASLGWLALIVGVGAWLGQRSSPERRLALAPPWPWQRRAWRGALGLSCVLWLPVHMALGFQPWERYLLGLVPLLALWGSAAFPLRALGVPPAWGPRAARVPRPIRLLAPPPPAAPLRPDPAGGIGYPPGRLWLFGTAALLWLALTPAMVGRYAIAPHDGRWQGIAGLGAAIEALPAGTPVYYRRAGRPLAWYAAEARASLAWGGPAWQYLPESASPPYFLAVRADEPLPPIAEGHAIAARSGHFRLIQVGAGEAQGQRPRACPHPLARARGAACRRALAAIPPP